jgi:hypothetical protein
MQKELSPVTTLLLLLLFGGLLWAIFWFNGAAVGLPGLTHMHKSHDGGLYIMLGTDLYEHDAAGRHRRRIDLKELGVKEVIGDFGFFSNGDLLIRIGADERNFPDKLRQLFRRENLKPRLRQSAWGGLFRCDLTEMACVPFGKVHQNLDQSFFLAVDWETDRVLLTDPSRHRLMLLSSTGDLLVQTRQGLKFPNQVIYQNGSAYVANANRHEIAVFEVGEESLKRVVSGFLTAEVGTNLGGHIWPSAVANVAEQFWVVNSDNNMSNGIVVRFNGDGERLDELAVPETADIFSILPFRGEVLVNDHRLGQIYRYSPSGERLSDFQSAQLESRLRELAAEKKAYYQWMYILIGLLGIAFIAGLVIGLRRDMVVDDLVPPAEVVQPNINPMTPGIHWIDPDPTIIQRMKWLVWLFVALSLLFIFLLWLLISEEMPLKIFLMLGFILVVSALFFYLFSRFARQRLGILGDSVIAVDGEGRFSTAKSEQLFYSPKRLLVGNVVITLRTNQPFFPEDQLVAHLYPLLQSARYVTQLQMLGLVMRMKPMQTTLSVVVSALLLAVFIWLDNA